jgi:mono/diheme cytochrome c family protein
MTKSIRNSAVLALAMSLAGAMSFAQSGGGEATYKAKCVTCHGPAGTPSPAMAKAMGIKPVSDPDVKKLTVAEIEGIVKNGQGKMKPVAGLSDAQAKGVAEYFKTLK